MKEVSCSMLGYARWLRAQRPPFDWFFSMNEDEQEALAQVGDGATSNLALEIAEAIHNPELRAAEVQGDSQKVEETLAMQIAEHVAEGMARRHGVGRQPAPAPQAPATVEGPTLSGIKKDEFEFRRTSDTPGGNSLFGKPADPVKK